MKKLLIGLCLLVAVTCLAGHEWSFTNGSVLLVTSSPTDSRQALSKAAVSNLTTGFTRIPTNSTGYLCLLQNYGTGNSNCTNNVWLPVQAANFFTWSRTNTFSVLSNATDLASSAQTWIVSNGTSYLCIKAWGGGGGPGYGTLALGGNGGTASTIIPVTGGGTCTIYVAQGGQYTQGLGRVTARAWPGGGLGQAGTNNTVGTAVGGGGAYSAVYYNGLLVLVAAGGGGGAYNNYAGGNGGGSSGADGANGGTCDGLGGNQYFGGAGGFYIGIPTNGFAGSYLMGGDGVITNTVTQPYYPAGGGGGGWYGGGGGLAVFAVGGPGGGGSCFAYGPYGWKMRSYDSTDPDRVATIAVGAAAQSGVAGGPGRVIIRSSSM